MRHDTLFDFRGTRTGVIPRLILRLSLAYSIRRWKCSVCAA